MLAEGSVNLTTVRLLAPHLTTGNYRGVLESARGKRKSEVLLADLARKKFAATDQPRSSRGTAAGSRHIPAEVKRAVWVRDLGRCGFVGTEGRRCGERGLLEFHHVRPYAAGGEATVENVQLRCRRHNDYEARVYFGQDRSNGLGGFVGEEAAPYAVRPSDTADSFRNEFDRRSIAGGERRGEMRA